MDGGSGGRTDVAGAATPPPPTTPTINTPTPTTSNVVEVPPPTRRSRLQRSERLQSDHSATSSGGGGAAGSGSYSSWEALVRDSFGHVAWPMKITSWELVPERSESVPKSSSSATELISRRGVFSRRHYGSVDQLPQTELDGLDPNSRRFRLENGESMAEIDEVFGSPNAPILENPEQQTRWYFKYFLGKVHQNYVGIGTDKHPYFMAIVPHDSVNQNSTNLRVMLFRKEGTQKILYQPQPKNTMKHLLAQFSGLDPSKSPRELLSVDIQKDLLLLEEQEGSVNFKFGVVYMKPDQRCDDEMLSNEHGSAEFEEFLQLLGQRITLRGWERFRGGLDVKGDMTGQTSVYTLYEGHEIMFHVSTLLPFSQDNRQQVERKRHIGNDIVNVVFVDGDIDDADFQPTCIKSQFTHIFAVVSIHCGAYKVAIYCDETVPPFGPTLPMPPHFTDATAFREFLLVKLINGEKATFQTPTFARKRERTLEMLIKDLYEENVHDGKSNMLNRRAFSEVLYDVPRNHRLKEDARQVEFVRIGQALKLEAIVRGDAPTSLASAAGTGSVFRRPPWEPQCFYAAFRTHRSAPICGDSFGADAVFVAADEGTFLIHDDQSHRQVFDRTLAVRQINVVEDHGLLLVRGGSPTNKDGHRVYCFRLDEFRTPAPAGEDGDKAAGEWVVRGRVDVRSRRMDKTRGCHLHTVTRGADGLLRMAVAVGRKLLTFQWRHTATWAAFCPRTDPKPDPVDGWILVREQTLHDVPSIMTILESPAPVAVATASSAATADRGWTICIGFKHHFELYCAQTGVSTKLHEVEASKHTQTNLVSALDLCDGQETEMLLCYNHTCHFQKLNGEPRTTEFDFQWNTNPTSVICAFPYIIGFSGDSMEIRLLVNGNLVHTMTMANLSLISAKRDIYFATTAPEFIQRELRIRGSETDDDALSTGTADTESATPFTGRPRLLVDELPPLATVASRPEHCIQRARSLQKPRASMLAGSSNSSVDRRNISKSVSCTEAYVATTDGSDPERRVGSPTTGTMRLSAATVDGAPVPPNTPRISSCNSSEQPASPGRSAAGHQRLVGVGGGSGSRLALRSTSSPFHSYHGDMNAGGSSSNGSNCGGMAGATSGADKVKPLRIFRIPLTNLIGNHAHPYHMRSASVTRTSTSSTGSSSAGSNSAKTAVQQPAAAAAPAKIVEEQSPAPPPRAHRPRTPQAVTAAAAAAAGGREASPAAAAASSQPSDRIGVKRDKFNELSFNYGCTEPLFTSL